MKQVRYFVIVAIVSAILGVITGTISGLTYNKGYEIGYEDAIKERYIPEIGITKTKRRNPELMLKFRG